MRTEQAYKQLRWRMNLLANRYRGQFPRWTNHDFVATHIILDELEKQNLVWTPDLRNKVLLAVEKAGQERFTAQGNLDDADFAAGALAALHALGLQPIDWPASWTLGLMFGNGSPFRPEEAQKEA